MPAEVESMFSVRDMPWHRQGIVTSEYPGSWDEARRLAGLMWNPETEEVYVRRTDPDGNPQFVPVDGWQSIYRSDTDDVLWINRDSYAVIDHHEMGEIVEAVLANQASSGKPPACWRRAVRSGVWPCSTNRSSCQVTTPSRCPTWP